MGQPGGDARDPAKQMSAGEDTQGAVVDPGNPRVGDWPSPQDLALRQPGVEGILPDGTWHSETLLIHALEQRLAPWAEEAGLAAMNQLMKFITSFETSHARTNSEGGHNMSHKGLSFMLINVIASTDQQLLQILQTFKSYFLDTIAD